MKTRVTRKNPFEGFTQPNQSENAGFSDPKIKEEPYSQNEWGQPAQEFGGRVTNPFGTPNTYSQDSQYQDDIDMAREDTYNQASYGGQAWNPDANKAQQFGQYDPNQLAPPEKSGYGFGGNSMEGQVNDYLNEPPLLEDLGINPKQIMRKVLSVISLKKINREIVEDADLAGPILIAIIFGTLLLLRGKIEFGTIYGSGLTFCFLFYILFKVIVDKEHSLNLYTIMSVLGYCLIPFNFLATITLFLPIFNIVGGILGFGIICWSTYMATQFIEVMLHTQNKKAIIGFPIFLFYMRFLLITIF
ncbi:unnamed protein product [Moneuplotes crassus]|uniref:Protein YIPF n=1 Tax=Euplotes crassus TaxID=5936 RepID=A0AAD2CXX5_EUPCR|nr:unnamed protein product [Moneuplotes crassus]